MIALGADFGGPELKGLPIRTALRSVMNAAARLRSADYNSGAEGWVNPVFIVPGSISPDVGFDGFKLGHYSKKNRGLVVMIAVPAPVAAGPDALDFIDLALRRSVELAAEHFKKKGDPFSFIGANRLIDDVMKSVA
ncbi:MAG: hypothetical protein ACJ8FF_02050 [Sphingomicrobium sp.]